MNPHTRHCFVVTVHFGNPAATHSALRALRHGPAKPDRIIVIDHAQQPLTDAAASDVEVVRPQHNGGYGAGLNVGLGMLWARDVGGSDIVICMNPDVEVYPETMAAVRQWWADHPHPALVGVVADESGGTRSGVGHVQWWSGRALLPTAFPAAPARGALLPYVHGAFVMAPYETYLKIGGWPEHYFLYWEDVEVGARARAKRVPIKLAATVRVRHHCAEVTTPTKLYYQVRNGARFMERVSPPVMRWLWRPVNRVRWGYHRLHRGPRHRLIAQALTDTRRGVTGPFSHEPS